MDDLISRQAVIDALDEQIEQCNKSLSSFDISMKDGFAVKVERASLVAFREILEYLPPAELSTNLASLGTDCISRQQAIDAFNTNIDELVVSGKENADAVERYLNRVIDEIKQLPPIQPERKECEEREQGKCPWYAG